MEKTGRHKSLDKEVRRNVEWLKSFSYITKVVIGISESCRHKYSPGTLRWKMDAPGGFKMNAYSGNGVTDIFVKIDPIDHRPQVKEMIKERFPV